MVQAARLRQEEADRFGSAAPGALQKILEYPRRFRRFLHEVRVEMRQVNWPTRADVWSTTIVVIVTVAFFGAYFLLTDFFSSKFIAWLSKLLK